MKLLAKEGTGHHTAPKLTETQSLIGFSSKATSAVMDVFIRCAT